MIARDEIEGIGIEDHGTILRKGGEKALGIIRRSHARSNENDLTLGQVLLRLNERRRTQRALEPLVACRDRNRDEMRVRTRDRVTRRDKTHVARTTTCGGV